MIDFLRLIGLHNKKEKCLICSETVGKDAAVIKYSCADGEQQAFLCEKCASEFDQTRLGGEDEAI